MLFYPSESFNNEDGQADFYDFELNNLITEIPLDGDVEDDQTELTPDGIDLDATQEYKKKLSKKECEL